MSINLLQWGFLCYFHIMWNCLTAKCENNTKNTGRCGYADITLCPIPRTACVVLHGPCLHFNHLQAIRNAIMTALGKRNRHWLGKMSMMMMFMPDYAEDACSSTGFSVQVQNTKFPTLFLYFALPKQCKIWKLHGKFLVLCYGWMEFSVFYPYI